MQFFWSFSMIQNVFFTCLWSLFILWLAKKKIAELQKFLKMWHLLFVLMYVPSGWRLKENSSKCHIFFKNYWISSTSYVILNDQGLNSHYRSLNVRTIQYEKKWFWKVTKMDLPSYLSFNCILMYFQHCFLKGKKAYSNHLSQFVC